MRLDFDGLKKIVGRRKNNNFQTFVHFILSFLEVKIGSCLGLNNLLNTIFPKINFYKALASEAAVKQPPLINI